ncbi:PGPGW domain-containing protein [Geodermatophilus sp. URMC 62]|uniref:PGPGW domain-containing protein n=1 Tax=Geodermatophilus sp. URMC 62 TaxID=3423414 RepID=UPI00406D3217
MSTTRRPGRPLRRPPRRSTGRGGTHAVLTASGPRAPRAPLAARGGQPRRGGGGRRLIVLVGLLLVPLPGPGWPVVVVGLSFLGREFPWTARLSTWAQRRVREAVRWSRRRGRPASATSGAGGRSAEAVAVGR